MSETSRSQHNHEKEHNDTSTNSAGDIAVQQAFRAGFLILRFVMVLLLIAWLATGVFKVDKGEHAIEFFLGKMRERNNEKVISAGLYWTLPFPFSRVVKIKTQQEYGMALLSAVDHVEVDPAQETANDPIVKGKRLFQVTSDQNIIHTGWSLNYRIKDLESFVTTLYEEGDDNDGERKRYRWMKNVNNAVGPIFIAAVFDECRKFTAVDVLLGKNLFSDAVKLKVQKELDLMKSGIEISKVSMVDAAAPSSVALSFLKAFQAKEVKRNVITKAMKEKEKILSQIQSDVNRYRLMAQTEKEYLKSQMESSVSQFKALREVFKKNPDIRERYLESLYLKMLGEVINKIPVEYIGNSERITLRANAFQIEDSKQESKQQDDTSK